MVKLPYGMVRSLQGGRGESSGDVGSNRGQEAVHMTSILWHAGMLKQH